MSFLTATEHTKSCCRIGASGHHFKQKLLEAMVGSSVSLYFPSEFGVDHTLPDFPHAEWDAKKRHYDLAKKIVPDIKICRVFIGLLLEDSIGPWFGYDTTNSAYEAVGSSDTGISFTAFTDVGRVVATLATLVVSKIPDSIRVGGDTISMRKTALIMEAAGAGPVKVTQISLPEYKSAVLAEGKTTPEKFLRFLMGEGKINHESGGLGNGNELVNPGGRSWQWKTMSTLAEETNGKPWFGTIWNLAR